MIFPEDVERWFDWHDYSPPAAAAMQKVREGAKAFAFTLLENTPHSADQAASFRLLRQCVATANAAVVLNDQTP